jgi:photosystem II stability/assembly factor-like uncharacterized protein
MKSRLHSLLLCATLATGVAFATSALADPVTIVGPVTKIELAKDGKSADATLKDNKGGGLVLIYITDDLTLDKFKDKRIQVGDEIRTRFEKGDKNLSRSFKKTAGC